MVRVIKMDTVIRFQIQDDVVCISHGANAYGKGMHPFPLLLRVNRTKWLEKKLDGNYTRMLRAILNKSWRKHPSRYQLYGHLPPFTKTIQDTLEKYGRAHK